MRKKMIWSDEFNYTGAPNPEIWNIETGGTGFGNKELQYYTNLPENVYVNGEKLVITAKKEHYEHCQYTSAKLTTHGKKSILHGRIEVSAKLPIGKGTWPAIWFLGNNIREGAGWPKCGEIDLMEHVGKDIDRVHFSLHTKTYNHRKNNHQTHIESINNTTHRFIEYVLEWRPNEISFFADGHLCATFRRGEGGRDTDADAWPFNDPHYLIINLAIGGTWGGEVDDAIFPTSFEIDYVRVYELLE